MSGKRKRGEPKSRVLELFDAEPTLTSHQIADRLGFSPEYVRATLKRNNRKLYLARGSHRNDRQHRSTP